MWIEYDFMISDTFEGEKQITGFINMNAIKIVRMGVRSQLETDENGIFIEDSYFCFSSHERAVMTYNTIVCIIKNPNHTHVYKLIEDGKQFGQIIVN